MERVSAGDSTCDSLTVSGAAMQGNRELVGRVGRRGGGFTLIELLVVICIIGILSGMLLVGVARARQYAWKTQCLSNLRQCGQALTIYHDNNGRFPTVTNRPSLGLNDLPSISAALAPYAAREVFKCGADREGVFEREQSSYEWNIHLNGRTRTQVLKEIGEVLPGADTEVGVLWDYEPFHGKPDAKGSRNLLYLDGHAESF